MLVTGLGLATTVAPLTSTALSAVEDRYAGVASGVNTTVARAAQLTAVAALPLAAGITGETYLVPAEFSDGFHTAIVITAVLAAPGGVIAFPGIRNPEQDPEAVPEVAEAPRWFCGAEGPPLDTCPARRRRGRRHRPGCLSGCGRVRAWVRPRHRLATKEWPKTGRA